MSHTLSIPIVCSTNFLAYSRLCQNVHAHTKIFIFRALSEIVRRRVVLGNLMNVLHEQKMNQFSPGVGCITRCVNNLFAVHATYEQRVFGFKNHRHDEE